MTEQNYAPVRKPTTLSVRTVKKRSQKIPSLAYERQTFSDSELETEEWKPVVGYEGLYGVSDLGRVRRKRLLRPGLTRHGYEIVVLSKSAKRKTLTVHRLVTIAFVSNPDNKPEVNHKDGDKVNNRKTNLEWCTSQENTRHAFDNGLVVRKKRSFPNF